MSDYGFFNDSPVAEHDDSAEREVERLQAELAAVRAERDALVATLMQLAKDIEAYSAEDPDNDIQTCRYVEHMQGLCGCRDLAMRLRAIAAARKQQEGTAR